MIKARIKPLDNLMNKLFITHKYLNYKSRQQATVSVENDKNLEQFLIGYFNC